MNLTEFLTVFCLLAIVGITGAKMLNVMQKGKLYDKIYIWVGFAAFWFAYLLLLLLSFTELTVLSSLILSFANLFILLNTCFFLAEILLKLGLIGQEMIQSKKAIER